MCIFLLKYIINKFPLFLTEKHKINNYLKTITSDTIDKTRLNEILNSSKTKTGKLKILNHIKNKNIKLTGEWGEGNRRPRYNIPEVDNLLAELDIRDAILHK
jgi:hypothetical protein